MNPKYIFVASVFILSLFCLPLIIHASQSITLDGNGSGRIFEGLGAVSAGASSRLLIDYPEPYRGQILDYLFKPHYGASLQDLKVEIGGDMDSTDGSEPTHMRSATDLNFNRGYEWWLMKEAKLRNPNLTLGALEWGAPGWIGNGQFYSTDNINYIINFINGAKNTHNLTIDNIGIWNETDYDINWIKNLKTGLLNAGLSTKIVAADSNFGWNIVYDMSSDPALAEAVDIIGTHYPNYESNSVAQAMNKPLWSSEDGPWRGDWIGAASLAKTYNRNYIQGKMTKTQVWSPVTSYYDILPIPGSGLMYANTPWSGNYNILPAIWITGHTTQFAEPGWQYIDNSSGYLNSGGSLVTLKNTNDYSVIIETIDSAVNQNVTFNIVGGLSTSTIHVWKSDENQQFVQQSDIIPVEGSFTIDLAPRSVYSLTTTSGQSKGNVASAVSGTFPFPYEEDFESYTAVKMAKYLSDINGAFETYPCATGHTGMCLRQMVTTMPIAWHYAALTDPASFIGSADWQNYQVSADVFLEQPGSVKMIGRLSREIQISGDLLAYQFYVSDTGNWSLRSGSTVLIAGIAPFSLNTWHNIKLVMDGNVISGVIDGLTVGSYVGSAQTAGMAGLGTAGWINAQFDNFKIEPITSSPPPPPPVGGTIPQSQMTVIGFSTQAPGYEAVKAIDGNTANFWHTSYISSPCCSPAQPLPQSLTISLGGVYNVSKVRYRTRLDGNLNGTITSYKIYTSTDGVNFTPVATGNWPDDTSEKIVTFTPISASHLRLEAVAGHSGYAAINEINVEYNGSTTPPPPPPPPPPPTDITPPIISSITTSDITPSSATISWATDESSNSLAQYGLTTSYGSTIISQGTVSHSATLPNLSSGTLYNYRISATDASGNNSLSVNQSFITSSPPPPPPVGGTIPQSQMTVIGFSTQAPGYEAVKAIDGNTANFWHTSYISSPCCSPAQPLPQSLTISLGGVYNVSKVRYRTRLDGNLNGTITSYKIYTSTDGVNFTPVATGNWPDDTSEKIVTFTPISASHLRLEAVAGHSGYAAINEINVEY